MLPEFKLSHSAAEAAQNTCVKGDSLVVNCTVTG